MIDRLEVMTADQMINWLRTLSDGYAKPDLSKTGGGTGTVRETKKFMPFIMRINNKLCEMSGLECPPLDTED